VRTRDPEEKKRRIVKAATKLFVENGYFPTTLAQIAAEASCSKSTITQHFGTKNKLASTILLRLRKELAEHFARVSEGLETAEKRVRAEVRAFVTWCVENPHKALYLHALRHSEWLDSEEPELEPIMDLVKSQVVNGQRHGEVRSGRPFLLGIAYSAPTATIVRLVLEGRLEYDLLELVDDLGDLAWDTVSKSKAVSQEERALSEADATPLAERG